ncbi:SHOCT domain-containing protein [Acetobacterium sp. UBA5834]|uniref:SHOCT domain-containing protein n=1 Tax=Acetobacterium sp. UBA5834 TaxID=1945907 RepID=UPI00257C1246|nr:SHOCT domain-containing protein [Acetobacterium sp. UBA5834]
MKKNFFIFILSLLTVLALSGISFAEEMVLKSPDVILSEIMVEQGIKDATQIDPSKVRQETLEKLGDSVMEKMIGNSVMHEQMDIRLGGEGSESLKAFHINLAINYLTDYPNGMMNLMSGGMMSNRYSSTNSGWFGNGMMNNNSFDNSGWNTYGMMNSLALAAVVAGILVIFLIVIIGVIIFAVVRSKNTPIVQEKSLEILGIRYANGEITKAEFDGMTKNIRSLK